MKLNKASLNTLYALSHPASIAAIFMLLLNDHVLRRLWPSWWTGKLGDFAWLIFAPFVLALILAWLVPARVPNREKRIGQIAIVVTGLGFALAKTIPVFHELALRVLELLSGWEPTLRRDPTDLLALPALAIAWHIWKDSGRDSPLLASRGLLMIPLVALVTIANSAAPNYGIVCLIEENSNIVASAFYDSFLSEDGGLTWQEISDTGCEGDDTSPQPEPWQLADPDHPNIQYRFMPGVAIERSKDNGQTWTREVDLAGMDARLTYYRQSGKVYYRRFGPLDALVHRQTGQVVVAMGQDGVLLRTAGGEWIRSAVGSHYWEDLNNASRIVAVLSNEIWLGFILIGLTLAALALRVPETRVNRIALAVGWLLWLIALISTHPELNSGIASGLAIYPLALASLASLVTGIAAIRSISSWQLRALPQFAAIAIIVSLLFLLPYVLWTQGSIPQYWTAIGFAVALAVLSQFAGARMLQHTTNAFQADDAT